MRKVLIIAIVLVIGGFVGLYLGYATHPATTVVNSSASISSSSPKAAELSASLRQLGEDQITWTRMYIIDLASNNGFADADLSRLMKNQEEIGNALKQYYGTPVGDTLTKLLIEHISGMVNFAKATKSQDTNAQSKASTVWYTNADQIADFLAKQNANWSSSDMRFMMKSYVDMTKQEATDILGNKYGASITDYDTLQNKILQVADTLSIGIRQQFPEKF